MVNSYMDREKHFYADTYMGHFGLGKPLLKNRFSTNSYHLCNYCVNTNV